MARKVKSARSKKEKKPLKEPKSKKDRSKSMLPGAQQDSLSGGGLTAALAGKVHIFWKGHNFAKILCPSHKTSTLKQFINIALHNGYWIPK